MKISGTKLSLGVYEGIRKNIFRLKKSEIIPQLVIVKSCDTGSVNSYIGQKIKKGEQIGIKVKLLSLDESILINQNNILKIISLMNDSDKVHGIIFQKPGDDRIDVSIESIIDPIKDVDGFLPNSRHESPTYRGLKHVLNEVYEGSVMTNLRKRKIAVIGKGKTGGAPIINGLLKDRISKNNLSIIDSKTSEEKRKKIITDADIIVSAVGRSNPVDFTLFSKKTILIDIGIHFTDDGKIKPDFNENDISDRVGYYTTTPGGIGVLTVAFLMDNVVNSAMQTITS